ncbi:MAG: glucokinase [Betaproteobacteria bacterium HGW-Betaproteobacteria-22]|nr:MAG: glucokinase [Betaproteobacteria bacterium HGW-Betaproteobacteria-22]
MVKLVGIDVGGTNLRVGVVEYSPSLTPRLVDEIRFQADFSGLCKSHTPERAWREILAVMADAIGAVRNQHAGITAVGIGFPGFIDPLTQCIALSPNLPGLHGVDLSADLSALIKLPVVVENDALAAAFGEYVLQPNQTGNLIYLGLGTGVGGGLVLNGKPFQGQHGVAMEVGHIIVEEGGRPCGCGNFGCMEQYASASGVVKSYFDATRQRLTAAEIASRAGAGDQSAEQAYQMAGKMLGKALAHILKVIDVTDVIIGGGMSAGWTFMQSAFTTQLDADLIPVLRGHVHVRVSTVGDQAGMLGAAMLATA